MAKICFTTILVDDMEKALGFYVDVLGFTVIKRDHYPHFVALNQETHPVALHLVEKLEPAESRVILGIATDDLNASLAELSAKGVELLHTTPQKFFGGYYVGIKDPSGNMLELIQWTPELWAKYTASPVLP